MSESYQTGTRLLHVGDIIAIDTLNGHEALARVIHINKTSFRVLWLPPTGDFVRCKFRFSDYLPFICPVESDISNVPSGLNKRGGYDILGSWRFYMERKS